MPPALAALPLPEPRVLQQGVAVRRASRRGAAARQGCAADLGCAAGHSERAELEGLLALVLPCSPRRRRRRRRRSSSQNAAPHPPVPAPQALDAARGLHHLHSHAPPIIHRDIKVGARTRVGAGSSAAASVAAHAASEGQLASAEVPAAVHTEWPLPPPQSPNLLIDYGWRAKVAE